jgi:hypothetical protein
MSRNTKHKHFKRFIYLDKRFDELRDIRRNLGYEELEKPYPHGYDARLVLREDIARRKDADMLQLIVDKFSTKTWSKTGKFTNRFFFKKRWHFSDNTPKIKMLSEAEYLKLDEKLARYFYHSPSWDTKRWDGSVFKHYVCNVPSHFFVIKIKVSYITHKKVIDSELENLYEIMQPYNQRGKGFVRRFENKRDRRHNNAALTQNLKSEILIDSEYWSDWVPWRYASAWTEDPYPFRYKPKRTYSW